jgi:2-oxoglutarate ferredoxin oxidoreductase subunit gamma
MPQTELRVAGLGGQGVILCGMIIGKAATLFQDGYATLIQSFGPEARGSACSAQVILSETPILYPYVTRPSFWRRTSCV